MQQQMGQFADAGQVQTNDSTHMPEKSVMTDIIDDEDCCSEKIMHI